MKNEIQQQPSEYTLAPTGTQAYDSQLAAYRHTGRPHTFDQYAEWIRQARTPETRNLRIKSVKAALLADAKRRGADTTLVKMRLDDAFKSAGLKPVKVNQSVQQEDCLTVEQVKILIRRSQPRTGLIVRTLYNTACRVSELLDMQYRNCRNLKDHVEITITGKGNRERRVFVPVDLFDEIRETFKSSTHLFGSRDGKAYTRQYVHRCIRDAGRRYLNIENLHPHTLRHSWATANLDTIGLHKVSKYLGHADVSTTSRFYLHNEPDSIEIGETAI